MCSERSYELENNEETDSRATVKASADSDNQSTCRLFIAKKYIYIQIRKNTNYTLNYQRADKKANVHSLLVLYRIVNETKSS